MYYYVHVASYDMNHSITNLKLKQNVFENRMKRLKYMIVYSTALVRERTTVL